MIDSKNQIIKSMKSYELGGSSKICSDGKKRCRKKFKNKSASEKTGSVLGTILGAGASVAGGLGIKKMMDKQKNGGSVKTKMKTMIKKK